MKVRYTPRARGDLVSILTYIDERSPIGAQSVKRAIRRVIEFIGEYPNRGRGIDPQGTRVLPVGRYPYVIYWTIKSDEVWIVHIRHAARRPWQGSDEKR